MLLNSFYDKYIFLGELKFQHNNFFLMKIPFAMVPTQLLLFEKFLEDKEFNKKLYYSLKDAVIKSLKFEFGVNFSLEGQNGLVLLERFFSASGFGLLTQSDLNKEKKQAIIVVNNSPFALKLSGKTTLPVDHLLRGIFAGIFSVFFNENVDCVETECSALSLPRCTFIIKPLHEFDFSNPQVRQQLDTE